MERRIWARMGDERDTTEHKNEINKMRVRVWDLEAIGTPVAIGYLHATTVDSSHSYISTMLARNSFLKNCHSFQNCATFYPSRVWGEWAHHSKAFGRPSTLFILFAMPVHWRISIDQRKLYL